MKNCFQLYVEYSFVLYSFYSDIPNEENITIQIFANDYGFGYYNSRGTFNLSSNEVYTIPFAIYTHFIYMYISITYPDTSLLGRVYICEIEVKG